MPTDGAPFSVAVGKHFNFGGGMSYFWLCGEREWAMVVMGKQQGMWCIVPRPQWRGLVSGKHKKKQRVPTLITRNSKCVRRSTCFAEGCTCCLTSVPLANADVAEQRNVVTASLATSLSSFIFFKHFNLYIYRMPWDSVCFQPGGLWG